jgi:hypothetical protein
VNARVLLLSCCVQVGVAGVENVNLSKLVAGHQDYLSVTGDILEVLNLHC